MIFLLAHSFLLAACLSTGANAFVNPTSSTCGKACARVASKRPSDISLMPRTNSVRVKTSEAIDVQNPFTKMQRKRRLSTGMAFLAGVADLTLNMKYKTFATMMTGNTMWMALALAEQRFMDATYYASVIMSYITGLTVFRKIDLSFKNKTLPICSFLVASLFIGSDLIFQAYQSRWIPMLLLGSGFGIINSVGQEVSGTLTFVITGHLTRSTNMIIDRLSRTAGRKKMSLADKQSFIQNLGVFGGFLCGAAFAGILKAKGLLVERVGVFSAIGLAHAGLWLWKDMESLGGAWWLRKDKSMCDVDDTGEACLQDEVAEVEAAINQSTKN